jgi:hypothetical protein
MPKTLLLAVGLGIATCSLIGAANHLPCSPLRDDITDVLSLPGGLIAGIVYPEGVHTGNGAPYWGLMAMLSNWAFYSLLWFVCLRVVGRSRRKGETSHP